MITSTQIEQVQVLGRDVTSIMRLLPGVRYENTVDSLGMSFGTDVPNVGGARRDWSNVIVDGVVANEVGASNLMAQQINLDAIAEVRILLNTYRAEYGRAGGGQVQIVSKSGGAELPRQPLLLRPPRDAERHQLLHQPGRRREAALSLQHLRRATSADRCRGQAKKLFFFYSMEAPLVSRPGPLRNWTMPTDAEMRGDFSQTLDSQGRLIFIKDPQRERRVQRRRPAGRLLPRQHHPGQPHQPERPRAAEHAAAGHNFDRTSPRGSSTTRRRRTPRTRR